MIIYFSCVFAKRFVINKRLNALCFVGLRTFLMKQKGVLYQLTVLFLIFSFIGCGARDDETSPDMAKSMLRLSGFEFTEEGFFRAIRLQNSKIVRAFLQAGMDPNAKNKDGETALTYALQNSDIKTTEVLLEQADLNLKDDKGNAPIHLAIKKDEFEPVFLKMLEKGADPNIGGRAGKTDNQTTLYVAVLKNREDLVKTLLEKGADPNKTDSDGAFPLAEAAIGRINPEIVKLLLDKGANINAQEKNGATALIYVASNKKTDPTARAEVIKLLLDKGADKSIKDENGKTAEMWAKELGNKDSLELLK